MLKVFRPSFEVVKEGRILKKIKHLQRQFVGGFILVPVLGQVLDENGMFLTEKMSWKYYSPYESIIKYILMWSINNR
jgi:hypothetical protein